MIYCHGRNVERIAAHIADNLSLMDIGEFNKNFILETGFIVVYYGDWPAIRAGDEFVIIPQNKKKER